MINSCVSFICNHCHHSVKALIGDYYRCDDCHHLITVDRKAGTESWYDSGEIKTHTCSGYKIPKEIICPYCSWNVFAEPKVIIPKKKCRYRKAKNLNIPEREVRR